jgi:hypothetical protein
VIGYLSALSEAPAAALLAAFRRGLSETGFAEGRNVAIEFRWAEGQYQRLPAMAAELVSRPVSLILAQSPPAAIAAKAASGASGSQQFGETDTVWRQFLCYLRRRRRGIAVIGIFPCVSVKTRVY